MPRPVQLAVLAVFFVTGGWGWADPAATPEWTGYYKNLLALTDVHDNLRELDLIGHDVQVDDIQRVRLMLDYEPAEHIALEVHYEVRAVWGDSVRIQRTLENRGMGPPVLGTALSPSRRARFLDLEDDVVEEATFTLGHQLDRLRLRMGTQEAEWLVGRQAVSWGSGLIWTPTDLFSAFAPNEIDRDEKLGVDVARLIISPGHETTFDLVIEPLDTNETYAVDHEDSAVALRATTHLGEYDLAALAGYVAGDRVAGGDFSGYLKDAGFRGEWLYTDVAESGERDYQRALLSIDYSFARRWDPYLALEYHYNGLGEDDPDDYLSRLEEASVQRIFNRGTAFNLGRNYLGAIVRVVPSALVTLQNLTLLNLDDGSALAFATLSRSLSDNVEIIFGANVGIGPLGTEFGGFTKKQAGVDLPTSDYYYTFLKAYF